MLYREKCKNREWVSKPNILFLFMYVIFYFKYCHNKKNSHYYGNITLLAKKIKISYNFRGIFNSDKCHYT